MIRVLLLVLLLSGCIQEDYNKPKYETDAGIYEVYLKDGTRCIEYYTNGLSCDFQGIKHPERYKGNNGS